MQFLQSYFHNQDQEIKISAQQGSDFAKNIAGDFNPIHNPDSKRFCIPGDLLFAIALDQYGLYQKMNFQFLELVAAKNTLIYPVKSDQSEGQLTVINERQHDVLKIDYADQVTRDSNKIEPLLKNYVSFSGMNFPDILVPLMQQNQVMINPNRPLVIYQSMSLELNTFDYDDLQIVLDETSLHVDGRRGEADLHFNLNAGSECIGTGVKTLILSGLREYEEETVKQMCKTYESYKAA